MTVTASLAEILAEVAAVMAPALDAWWIIGSASLALHGVAPLDVSDVDILLSEDDARYVLPRLGLQVLPGEDDGRFRSRIFGRWDTPTLAVEFMAGLEIFDGTHWSDLRLSTRERIECGRGVVFVPSRIELARILARFGRTKDFERMRLLGQ